MGELCLDTVKFATCMHMLSNVNMFNTHGMLECSLHTLALFDFYAYFVYVKCFYTCFLFRQTSQYGTTYRLQVAVPEDMWARLSGVCEGPTTNYRHLF